MRKIDLWPRHRGKDGSLQGGDSLQPGVFHLSTGYGGPWSSVDATRLSEPAVTLPYRHGGLARPPALSSLAPSSQSSRSLSLHRHPATALIQINAVATTA